MVPGIIDIEFSKKNFFFFETNDKILFNFNEFSHQFLSEFFFFFFKN